MILGNLDLHRSPGNFFGQDRVNVRYQLNAGQLIVRDMRVSTNTVFRHTAGTISHSGTLTLAGGTWETAPGQHQLGVLKLDASSTNSSLVLRDSPTVLRFTPSAATAWNSAAELVIHNWRGATNGGGSHQVIFGTDASGLSPQQVAQIRFRNPTGLPAGEYATTILGTGEVVPLSPTGRDPSITFQKTPGQLRMEWPSGYTLQTATNVSGPFLDVNTDSPYTVETGADSERFFRLRQ